MSLISRNPATEEVYAELEELSENALEGKLERAHRAFHSWRAVPFAERSRLMHALADVLRAKKDAYGTIITEEMGKTIGASVAEIEKCAWVCDFYADNAEQFLSPEPATVDGAESYVRFDPLGVVLAVMPWNFPFWQVFRFAAPAAMAGNAGILKHASNVPRSAMAIEEAFKDAGFPEGVFQNLAISASRVESVLRDPRIAAATLTGSESAGMAVASVAGAEIKKTVLELGGSDPFIVLADADVVLSCDAGASARLQNAGQSCIAAKRFVLVESVAEEFIERYVKLYQSMTIGNPMDPATSVGPLATNNILKDVERQVETSVAGGARVVTGGKRLPGKGYFYAPTIMVDVKKGMPAYDEEIFGPVAAMITVKDEEEAIRVANDTRFGLGASIWSRDTKRAEEIAKRIESGAVFINSIVKSDPRVPFGGIKKSGYGRELSHYGIREFTNIKTVWVSTAPAHTKAVQDTTE